MGQVFINFFKSTGIYSLELGQVVMIFISFVLLYLAIVKKFEPFLLIPIAFGMFLTNLPLANMMSPPIMEYTTDVSKHGSTIIRGLARVDVGLYTKQAGGLLYYLYQGDALGIFPPIIFMGVGAMTDFGPLIANPKSLLLGAAAQFGIFMTFIFAVVTGLFTVQEASAIAIIGGADGPTAMYAAAKLASHLLGPIAVAAYSYMALVPIIQPPIMRMLTTESERKIKMEQLREVSRLEKIVFPILVTLIVTLIVPAAGTLIGMLMLGNLLREVLIVDRLKETVSNALMNTVTVFLGITVGATATAERFLDIKTLAIMGLGIVAFSVGTATGVLLAKLMNKFSKTPINPLIGSAGVSAVPMAARVSQAEGIKYNSSNYLLMHAMGPNVAGVIGSAVAAGVLLSLFL